MITTASEQTRRTLCIAIQNHFLHQRSICPGNHEVDYCRGWFYFDGVPRRDPELSQKADELQPRLEAGQITVYFSPTWNTYVLNMHRI